MDKPLDGRIALVAGATRGAGRGIANPRDARHFRQADYYPARLGFRAW